jgi:hypothetical protein
MKPLEHIQNNGRFQDLKIGGRYMDRTCDPCSVKEGIRIFVRPLEIQFSSENMDFMSLFVHNLLSSFFIHFSYLQKG